MKIKEYLREHEKSGFTLVELLVVIVIIGILATGVLAAINPIEQIRRGRDTVRQSAAREVMSAAERYYGTHNGYGGTWQMDAATDIKHDSAIITDLIDAEELRSGFSERSPIQEEELSYYIDSTSEEIRVCFQPESTTFLDQATCEDPSCSADGNDWYCVPDSG
ncbi:MAG: prepilin-type N-terminal cleavage/methylation domain-containing protein [Patescibacteria group bacterium]|nr:prepilin-type N-terminal cleavage/methylation domain-containing protein [Patescibacteria group bacterium]